MFFRECVLVTNFETDDFNFVRLKSCLAFHDHFVPDVKPESL